VDFDEPHALNATRGYSEVLLVPQMLDACRCVGVTPSCSTRVAVDAACGVLDAFARAQSAQPYQLFA
jgi:hypothetical protein